MTRLPFILVCLAVTLAAAPGRASAGAPDIAGDWSATEGVLVARIARCAPSGAALCATVIRDAPVKGEKSSVGQVVVNGIGRHGKGWKGRYVADGESLPASVSVGADGLLRMKVCKWFLCQTLAFRRA